MSSTTEESVPSNQHDSLESSVNLEETVENNVDVTQEAGSRLYNQGKEMLKKLDQRRKSTPTGCTFSPAVNKKKSMSAISPEKGSRFDHLYQSAEKRKQRLEEKRQSIEPQYTFTPEITKKGKRLSTKLKTTGAESSVFNDLYKNASQIKEKQIELKAQIETEGCTFKPKINETTKWKSTGSSLYDAEKAKKIEEDRKQKQLEREMEGCTFKPETTKKSLFAKSATVTTPFHQRLLEAEQRKLEKIERLRKEKEEEELRNATFQPSTSSTPLSTTKKASSPVYDRLYKSGNKAHIAQEREKIKEEEERKKFSFKPNISQPLTRSGKKERSGSIFDRLYTERTKKDADKQKNEKVKEEQELKDCTFSPSISKIDGVALGKSKVPIWERLQEDPKEKIRERERLKEESVMKECSFVPVVSTPDKVAKKLITHSPVWERLQDNSRVKKVAEREKLSKQLELKECTFKPQVSSRKISVSEDVHVDKILVNVNLDLNKADNSQVSLDDNQKDGKDFEEPPQVPKHESEPELQSNQVLKRDDEEPSIVEESQCMKS